MKRIASLNHIAFLNSSLENCRSYFRGTQCNHAPAKLPLIKISFHPQDDTNTCILYKVMNISQCYFISSTIYISHMINNLAQTSFFIVNKVTSQVWCISATFSIDYI